MGRKIKAILLDLGGVVFQSSGFSNDVIQWNIINDLNHKYGHQLNIGQDYFPIFLEEYNRLTNQSLTGNFFLQSIFDTIALNEELVTALKALFDIIIVSDNYRENINYVSSRYNFNDWSIMQFYSFDFQMEKSDPRFFKRLLLECSAYNYDELLLIDDSLTKLESAASNKIEGIHFLGNDQVLKELTRKTA